MTRYQKSIFQKELLCHLPFGVVCCLHDIPTNRAKLSGIIYDSRAYFEELDWKENDGFYDLTQIKPFLRPLYSMSKEDREKVYEKFGLRKGWKEFGDALNNNNLFLPGSVSGTNLMIGLNKLYKDHYDLRGLLEMDLAKEVNENNNPY